MKGCDVHLERRSQACLNKGLLKVFSLDTIWLLQSYGLHPGIHILQKLLILEVSFAYQALDERSLIDSELHQALFRLLDCFDKLVLLDQCSTLDVRHEAFGT